jgi:lipopolysaccharide transport system permease protein
MSIFSIVFGKLIGIPSSGRPYPLFVLCGLVPWNFFSRAIASMTSSLVNNQELVKRVYFARMAIPISGMLSAAVDMVPAFALLFIALAVFQSPLPLKILLLPFFIAIMLAATLGFGFALSAWNVRFRDVGYIVPFALQVLLFMTPIVYPSTLLPEIWRPVYSLNPMVGVVEGMRWCILQTPVDWTMVSVSIASSVVIFSFGVVVFSAAEKGLPDLI